MHQEIERSDVALETPAKFLRLDDYERRVARLYDDKQEDLNLLLGRDSLLVHHHFGIGGFDQRLLTGGSDDEITRELHRLENAQVDRLIETFGGLRSGDRVFDGGSGRGGTALILNRVFGCSVDGATLSRYQYDFSQRLAESQGVGEAVRFHWMNMLSTGFAPATFDAAITNETTMYIRELGDLFRELGRILKPGGRYVLATWSVCEGHRDARRWIDPIDEHYLCHMHTDATYVRELVRADLIPYSVRELNAEAEPYWRLRRASRLRTGIEQRFLDGYEHGAIRYLMIGAQYLPRP